MRAPRRIGRVATSVLVTLGLLYLVLVAYPAHAGGFGDPSPVEHYGANPSKRPVPFFGDVTPLSTPSPTADRAPLAWIAALTWLASLLSLIPLSIAIVFAVVGFAPAFRPVERTLHLIAVGTVITMQMFTLVAAGRLMNWLFD